MNKKLQTINESVVQTDFKSISDPTLYNTNNKNNFND